MRNEVPRSILTFSSRERVETRRRPWSVRIRLLRSRVPEVSSTADVRSHQPLEFRMAKEPSLGGKRSALFVMDVRRGRSGAMFLSHPQSSSITIYSRLTHQSRILAGCLEMMRKHLAAGASTSLFCPPATRRLFEQSIDIAPSICPWIENLNVYIKSTCRLQRAPDTTPPPLVRHSYPNRP